MKAILLNPNRDHSLLRKHPWIFSGAIDGVSGDPQAGETVEVFSADDEWLGRGAFSPQSQIVVRMWTFDEECTVNSDFFHNRIRDAILARKARLQRAGCTAARLVHGEGDGLPGVIVDRYNDVLVVQLHTAGAEFWRKEIVEALKTECPECSIYERSDVATRTLEGLEERTGPLAGQEPPEALSAQWSGLTFAVDVRKGQKTGAYLDQADTIPKVGALARGATVLDAFCNTGAFTMACLKHGAASVTSVDSSEEALARLSQNTATNGLDVSRNEVVCADLFTLLRKFRDSRRTFDLIILDPPKFADSKGHVERACRAYKDINLLAFKLLNPGGKLATFSCSGSVSPELFQKVVADAAVDSGRFARMVDRYTQAADHPVSLAFPEGFYLKGMLCEVRS